MHSTHQTFWAPKMEVLTYIYIYKPSGYGLCKGTPPPPPKIAIYKVLVNLGTSKFYRYQKKTPYVGSSQPQLFLFSLRKFAVFSGAEIFGFTTGS